MSDALMTFTSHIAGKNAKVRLYPDRLEWERTGGYIGSAVKTAGFSMVLPGLRKKDTDMIPVRSINGVSTKKEMLHTTVNVMTPGNVIGFRVSHGEAAKVKDAIQQLML